MKTLMALKACVVAAVAMMGMAANATVIAERSSTLGEGLQLVPAKYWLGDDGAPNAQGGACEMAHDGKYDACLPEKNGWLYLDFGSPRTVDTFAFAPRHNSTTWYSRAKNFKVAGSLDGVNWTILHEETANDWKPADGIYYHKVNAELQGPYRYVKYYNYDGKSAGGNITEACVYTPDSLLFSDQANPWTGTGIAVADDPEGVNVSVTFQSLTYAKADEIVVYAAQTDHVADYAAWAADAEAVNVTLGTDVDVNVAVKGKIAGCTAAGRWYWQSFAKVGGKVVAHGDGGVFSIGSALVYPTAYVKTGSSYLNAYDGNQNTILDTGSGGKWIVFDLSTIESTKHLASLRIWAYDATHYGHLLNTSVDFGYDDAGLAWDVTGTVSAEGATRVMKTVSDMPYGITWKENVQAVITTVRGYASPLTVEFLCDTVKAKPRYLRLYAKGGNISLREAEIRVADDPDDWAHFNHQSVPGAYGNPSIAYGQGLLPGGEEVTVTMPETSFVSADGTVSYGLDGWTLVITNAEGEVLESKSGTGNACTFTPSARSYPTLVWSWTTFGKVSATIRRYANNTLNEIRDLPYQLDDNNLNTHGANLAPGTYYTCVWDFGFPRDIAWMRFASRGGTYGAKIKFYGSNVLSNDSADWTLIYNQEEQEGTPKDKEWIRLDFDPLACYRYVKATDVSELAIYECQFWSAQTQLKAQSPCTWSSTAIDSPLPADGVAASAKLSFTTNGSEHVIAYAAHTDYGDDFAAWAANAEATSDAGLVKNGNTVQFRFADLANGVCYWRAFSVDPAGVAVASQKTVPFLVGTVGSNAKAYLYEGTGDRAPALPQIYDGNFNAYPTTGGWIVFDLKSLPAEYRPAALRIWTRADDSGWQRLIFGEVRWGYSDGTEEWNATEVEGQPANRPLFKAAAYQIPGITWGATSTDNFYNYYNVGDYQMEYLLPPRPPKSAAGQSPRYLFFQKVGQEISLREIELRLVKIPPGMAIIVR